MHYLQMWMNVHRSHAAMALPVSTEWLDTSVTVEMATLAFAARQVSISLVDVFTRQYRKHTNQICYSNEATVSPICILFMETITRKMVSN